MANKRLLIIILVLAGIYFVFLPLFWPEPEVELSVVSAGQSSHIGEATVTVHALHANIALFAVDGVFNVDKSKNNGSSVVAVNILSERNQKRWDSLHTLGISRWTWPRSYNFKIELPIKELREKTDADYVTGRIDVRLRYPDLWKGFTATSEAALVKSVKIMLPE